MLENDPLGKNIVRINHINYKVGEEGELGPGAVEEKARELAHTRDLALVGLLKLGLAPNIVFPVKEPSVAGGEQLSLSKALIKDDGRGSEQLSKQSDYSGRLGH